MRKLIALVKLSRIALLTLVKCGAHIGQVWSNSHC